MINQKIQKKKPMRSTVTTGTNAFGSNSKKPKKKESRRNLSADLDPKSLTNNLKIAMSETNVSAKKPKIFLPSN